MRPAAEEASGCSEEEEEEGGEKEGEQAGQSPGDAAGLRLLDEEITQAMANMEYPPQWKHTESHPREGK